LPHAGADRSAAVDRSPSNPNEAFRISLTSKRRGTYAQIQLSASPFLVTSLNRSEGEWIEK
ncbi:MAG: hypothetical protein ABIP55_03525, partial [Tepidisphaeraceae bacterium]